MLNIFNYQNARDDEEPETKALTKSQLYKLLASTYSLPSPDSRATSRSLLLRIRQNEVFRVERQVLLQFEANLALEDLVRQGSHNMTILVEKLTILLDQLGERPLGFLPGNYPEESWLYRVIRFVDQGNLLGVFKRSIPGAHVPDILASRMYALIM